MKKEKGRVDRKRKRRRRKENKTNGTKKKRTYVYVYCEYSRESENCLREFNNRWRVRVEEERKRRRGKILNSIVTRCSKMYSIDWFSNIAGYSIIKGYRNIFPFKKYRGWLAGIGNYAWLFAYCNFVASFQGRNHSKERKLICDLPRSVIHHSRY